MQILWVFLFLFLMGWSPLQAQQEGSPSTDIESTENQMNKVGITEDELKEIIPEEETAEIELEDGSTEKVVFSTGPLRSDDELVRFETSRMFSVLYGVYAQRIREVEAEDSLVAEYRQLDRELLLSKVIGKDAYPNFSTRTKSIKARISEIEDSGKLDESLLKQLERLDEANKKIRDLEYQYSSIEDTPMFAAVQIGLELAPFRWTRAILRRFEAGVQGSLGLYLVAKKSPSGETYWGFGIAGLVGPNFGMAIGPKRGKKTVSADGASIESSPEPNMNPLGRRSSSADKHNKFMGIALVFPVAKTVRNLRAGDLQGWYFGGDVEFPTEFDNTIQRPGVWQLGVYFNFSGAGLARKVEGLGQGHGLSDGAILDAVMFFPYRGVGEGSLSFKPEILFLGIAGFENSSQGWTGSYPYHGGASLIAPAYPGNRHSKNSRVREEMEIKRGYVEKLLETIHNTYSGDLSSIQDVLDIVQEVDEGARGQD